ncbi:MAG TPA: DASS family sodium-coupled anion symporter [Methylomirabilota bacterium]|jgi:L-tartrate/succinate antiporter
MESKGRLTARSAETPVLMQPALEAIQAVARGGLHGRAWRVLLPLAAGTLVLVLPRPEGLTPEAWRYFAVFLAVIVSLITEAVPGAVAGLIGITAATIFHLVAPGPAESIRWALTGFADTTVWLMFVAFMFALGYAKTGLGRRIALLLVRRLGGRTLGLGYAIALSDLALAPFVPSNTARSGGIVFPIVENIPALYGAAPGDSRRGIGAYVMWTAFATTCVTSSMFLTALAPNLLAVSLMKRIAHVDVSWTAWLVGFLPVGALLFLLQPLLIHRLCPPGVAATAEVPRWAERELALMGAPSRRELSMGALAMMALALWIFGTPWMSATTVALLSLCLMLVAGVVSWDDILAYRRGWNNLVWFATLITLADGLSRVGFLPWFARTVAASLGAVPGVGKVLVLVVVFFVAHYMFASLTAHATALLPVVLTTVVVLPDVPTTVVALSLSYTLGLMGILTPYATGSGPLYYGSGYVAHRDFWLLGLLFGALYLLAVITLEVPYLLLLHR